MLVAGCDRRQTRKISAELASQTCDHYYDGRVGPEMRMLPLKSEAKLPKARLSSQQGMWFAATPTSQDRACSAATVRVFFQHLRYDSRADH